jgi:hypothetical protein
MSKGTLDPVHGYILIEPELLKLIDLPIFQRLGRVRQLSASDIVYIGAHHTRKEHSIGAMFLAKKYGDHLFRDLPYEQRNRYNRILQIAGLYHDIGHGSYSHVWDNAVYSQIYHIPDKGHDQHRLKILKEKLTPFLTEMKIDPIEIEQVWSNSNKLFSAIIQGPVGVDRMDFIKRDTFYTATCHFGIIDIDRIVHNSAIYNCDGNQYLSYNVKVIPDIIQGLRSRLDMYLRVYLHKCVVASSILIQAMIEESSEVLDYVERTENLDKFAQTADDFILYEILSSSDPKLKIAKIYAEALYERRLPKMVSEKRIEIASPKFYPSKTLEILTRPADHVSEFKAIWRSRLLSNDFSSEFSRMNIHVFDKDSHRPFNEYWKSDVKVSTFYIERIYEYHHN